MKKQKLSIKGTTLTVAYPSIGKTFVTDYSKYPAAIKLAATAHGFSQKFGDAKSGCSPAEKYEMVQRIHESLLAGDWELTGTRDTSAIVIEAIVRLKDIPEVDLKKAIEAKPEKLVEWRENVKVRAEIAKIRAERAAVLVDDAEDDDVEIDLT